MLRKFLGSIQFIIVKDHQCSVDLSYCQLIICKGEDKDNVVLQQDQKVAAEECRSNDGVLLFFLHILQHTFSRNLQRVKHM